MRGLPGSGKSTRAREIDPSGENTCSTDDYHYIGGVYTFQPTKLEWFHGLNFQKFLVMLAEKRSVIVVDNTNIEGWHYCHYVEAAGRFGYEVIFEKFSPLKNGEIDWEYVKMCAERNTHGCPLAACERMARAFEEDNVTPVVS